MRQDEKSVPPAPGLHAVDADGGMVGPRAGAGSRYSRVTFRQPFPRAADCATGSVALAGSAGGADWAAHRIGARTTQPVCTALPESTVLVLLGWRAARERK